MSCSKDETDCCEGTDGSDFEFYDYHNDANDVKNFTRVNKFKKPVTDLRKFVHSIIGMYSEVELVGVKVGHEMYKSFYQKDTGVVYNGLNYKCDWINCHYNPCDSCIALKKVKNRPHATRDNFIFKYSESFLKKYNLDDVPIDGYVYLVNLVGPNTDFRGSDHCIATLEFNNKVRLSSPTVKEWVHAINSLRSHHFDKHYEMYCTSIVGYSSNSVVVSLDFDHGS